MVQCFFKKTKHSSNWLLLLFYWIIFTTFSNFFYSHNLGFSFCISPHPLGYNNLCWIYLFYILNFIFRKTLQSHIQRFYIRFSLSFKTGIERDANTYGNFWNSLHFEQPTGNHESHIFCQYCEAKICVWKWIWACT